MSYKILIIEDENHIADILVHNLTKEGFKADCAYDGEAGLKKALETDYDLILLDVMLPKLDGWGVLKELRNESFVPVIMLTAREEEQDKVTGLDLGADDYITKPFSMKELISRIKAHLRRIGYEKPVGNEKITYGRFVLDVTKTEVKKDGEVIDLSNKEFALLTFLISNPDKVYSREQLLSDVWQYDNFYGDLRAVDVMVRRIREKMEDNPAEPEVIQTKRGQGYFVNQK